MLCNEYKIACTLPVKCRHMDFAIVKFTVIRWTVLARTRQT